MGMWREVMAGNLSREGFEEKMLEIMGAVPYDWILEAQSDNGLRPVGLILGKQVGSGVEPFVEWFPWATARNQIEATAAYLKEVSKQLKIFVFAEESANRFWSHFVYYGLVRRGCKVIDYFSRGEHAMLYYTVIK
jgi:hypothetical protein